MIKNKQIENQIEEERIMSKEFKSKYERNLILLRKTGVKPKVWRQPKYRFPKNFVLNITSVI